jgi:hypothetical protein
LTDMTAKQYIRFCVYEGETQAIWTRPLARSSREPPAASPAAVPRRL